MGRLRFVGRLRQGQHDAHSELTVQPHQPAHLQAQLPGLQVPHIVPADTDPVRDFTEPAIWIAPPNSNSFSVSVVLPASGWEMMANVRRRRISLTGLLIGKPGSDASSGQRLSRERHCT